MYDLVIRGGTVVTPETVLTTDIGIFGEKIAALGDGLEGKAEVDASGKLVLPGAIDPHVHFSLPVGGTVSSDDFYSGSVAAACGGVTTVIDFTVGAPERTMADDLRNRLEDARPSVVDYSFHGEVVGWRPGRTAEISDAMARGIKSFKFFTAYGASGRRTDTGPLYHAFRAIAEGDGVAVVHAEDDSMIEASAALLSKEEWGRMGTVAEVRSDLCEASAVNTVGWIAAKAGVRCHIVHLSSALGLGEVEEARKKGALMTAETCPQYLLLTSGVYGGPQGHLFSATPALRTRNDNEALWRALGSGAVDFAATDHCPFTRTQKEWKGAFDRLPGGLPGVETLLPLLYSEGVLRGKLSLCSLARVTSEQAAKLYGLYPKKGCLFPGSDGDLVIFDPEDAWTIRAGALRMNVDFSPYEGLEVRGNVGQTISRGEIIYADGRFLGRRGRGKFLPR
jgi:dihydropyrimidinase